MVFRLLTKRQGEYLRLACAGHNELEIVEAFGTGVRNVRVMRSGVTTRIRAASIDEVCRMVEQDETPPAILHNRRVRHW